MASPSTDLAYTIYPVGDRGMTVQWGEGIDERTNDYIPGVFEWLKEKENPRRYRLDSGLPIPGAGVRSPY